MNEKCLKIIGTEKLFNYDDAKKACQREPFGRLFTITSPKEQGFMVNFLFKKNKTDHNLWIGLRKKIINSNGLILHILIIKIGQ
jgi:hypothetical protein